MRVIKTVAQPFAPSENLLREMIIFKDMTNDCVRIGLEFSVTSLKALSLKAYRQLAHYETASAYKLNAISRAAGILRNHRKAVKKKSTVTIPYVRKLMITTCYGVKVKDGYLVLPYGERVKLNRYVAEVLSNPAYTVRSATLTTGILSISYSKSTETIQPTSAIGIDRNLNNVSIAVNNGFSMQIDLSKAVAIKERYRSCRKALRRNDSRVQRRLYGKYGLRQSCRVQ